MAELLPIIHEGAGYVIVNKPAGITTEAFRDHDTVEARAWTMFQRPRSPKKPFVGIVHRLDRPVSGLLILARNKSTLRYLNQQFAEQQVSKKYRARTQVPLPSGRGSLSDYLTRDSTGRRATLGDSSDKKARLSTLNYQLLSQPEGHYDYEIEPITGRYHQIRFQLANAGSPIIGDELYGSPLPYQPNQIMLHASELRFRDTEKIEVVLQLPPNWSTTP